MSMTFSWMLTTLQAPAGVAKVSGTVIRFCQFEGLHHRLPLTVRSVTAGAGHQLTRGERPGVLAVRDARRSAGVRWPSGRS